MIFRKSLVAVLALLLTQAVTAREAVQLEHNGLRLNAHLQLAEGKSIREGVVLMTHGTLAHGQMEIMDGLQTLLAEHGLNTLSINLSYSVNDRSSAMFDCAGPHKHKHTDAVDEIGLWMGWLKQQQVSRIALLGHSRGGNQTAWYASEHADAGFDKVVLIAPATQAPGYVDKDYQKNYQKALAPLLARAQKLVAEGKGDTLMPHTDFIYCPDTTVTAAAFVNYYADEPRRDTPSLLKKIQQPVLVIAGSEDTVVQGLIPAVQRLADGKHVQLKVIDGADHFFRDLYADESAEAITAFLGW